MPNPSRTGYSTPGSSPSTFEGGHGKSDRDTHFDVVSRKILEISSKEEIKHLTDVQRALETINNTTAIQVRLLPMKVTKTVLKLPDLTSVSSFEKDKNTISTLLRVHLATS